MTESRDTLSALVVTSGLSLTAFASDVMGRDVRTVRRWLAGDIAIPESAAQWLDRVTVTQTRDGVRIDVKRIP